MVRQTGTPISPSSSRDLLQAPLLLRATPGASNVLWLSNEELHANSFLHPCARLSRLPRLASPRGSPLPLVPAPNLRAPPPQVRPCSSLGRLLGPQA